VLYTSEDAEHAVAEMLQPWRGQRLESFHLTRAGFPLALVEIQIPSASMGRIADLCDPSYLAASGTPPDRSASRFRHLTQPLARDAWEAGFHGLRWWSSFWGDWHTVVLFSDRVEEHLQFGTPEALDLDHTTVRRAADLLGMLV
jgi:hypothetical protein